MMSRNIGILMTCQCMATAAASLVVTIGGIAGSALTPDPRLATVPMSLMVVGTAATAVPAAMLMQRIGRRRGFTLAALAAALAALLGALALQIGSFVLFCLATMLVGCQLAFSQQYRFAAAESVPLAAAGRAVSLVLAGAVGGAFLGPGLATRASAWVAGEPFVAAFLALAVVFAVAALLLWALADVEPADAHSGDGGRRPLGHMVRQPVFVVAVMGGVVGQGVMTFVMTATPISMHLLDGYTLEQTAQVIRGHVLAMYLPSLASAALIGHLGTSRLMALGLAAFAATLVIALASHEYLHYYAALVLLGIGWNFLFVGGTSLLVQSYLPEERFAAQAVNDFCVFGTAALGSLLAGAVVHAAGWETVLWACWPAVAVMAAALGRLAVVRRRAPSSDTV